MVAAEWAALLAGYLSWNRDRDHDRFKELDSSDFASKLFLRELLACLDTVSRRNALLLSDRVERTLAGFPSFWPMAFHLLASYSLMAASSACS